ncbi:MAG TPA: RNA polymerase sigma factor [Chitinophagaceae bacterium]|jgi:RNA polymerase sigma-70 factor (ECF subfamily)
MIDAIKRGDEFAYEQAYIEYHDKVYFYFLKKTKSCEDARDLLQITFLKLWKYRRSLSAEYLLEQHLFQIARTVFIDYLRSQNKLHRLQETINRKAKESPSYIYTSTDFDIRSRLQRALSSMPEIRKKIFELNRLQGYSYQEIASFLSISVKAVDNNLSKAVKQLRKIFVLAIFFMANIF